MAFKKLFKFLFVILIMLNFVWIIHAYYEKTHSLIAKFAVALVKRFDQARQTPLYDEIYKSAHVEQLGRGAWDEDFGVVAGNERSFRHYYDPDEKNPKKGVKFYYHYYVWLLQGAKVSKPKAGRYAGALEWARDGAVSQWSTVNPFNWEGAIRAYDYTSSSKLEAYYRLGHVIHLLGDMAEPDHAANVPHPGSGFIFPDSLDEICGPPLQHKIEDLITFSGQAKSHLKTVLRMEYQRLKRQINNRPDYKAIGFERLIEDIIKPELVREFFKGDESEKLKTSWFTRNSTPPIQGAIIRRSKYLDDYFNLLARQSKKAVDDSAKYPLALGTRDFGWDLAIRQTVVSVISSNRIPAGKYEPIFAIPNIDMHSDTEKIKYSDLAWKLLNLSTELSAGLLEHFHDIVNPPPFVRSVKITQDGNDIYFAGWDDSIRHISPDDVSNNPHLNYSVVKERTSGSSKKPTRVPSMDNFLKADKDAQSGPSKKPTFEPSTNQNLKTDKDAQIEIVFGPNSTGMPKPIDKSSIKVAIGNLPITGGLDSGQSATTWRGNFRIQSDSLKKNYEQLQITISAKDAHVHFDPENNAFRRGFELDSNPRSPAKVKYEPPIKYYWQNYEPGEDKNHKLYVGKKSGITGYLITIKDPVATVNDGNEVTLVYYPEGEGVAIKKEHVDLKMDNVTIKGSVWIDEWNDNLNYHDWSSWLPYWTNEHWVAHIFYLEGLKFKHTYMDDESYRKYTIVFEGEFEPDYSSVSGSVIIIAYGKERGRVNWKSQRIVTDK